MPIVTSKELNDAVITHLGLYLENYIKKEWYASLLLGLFMARSGEKDTRELRLPLRFRVESILEDFVTYWCMTGSGVSEEINHVVEFEKFVHRVIGKELEEAGVQLTYGADDEPLGDEEQWVFMLIPR